MAWSNSGLRRGIPDSVSGPLGAVLLGRRPARSLASQRRGGHPAWSVRSGERTGASAGWSLRSVGRTGASAGCRLFHPILCCLTFYFFLVCVILVLFIKKRDPLI